MTLFPMQRDAWISECGAYRYALHREWRVMGRWVGFIMLNPSTADASSDDPTIRRCVGFARGWNAGGIAVRNLFALRSTDPAALEAAADPVGPHNDRAILEMFDVCEMVFAAWGSHPFAARRAADVLKLVAGAGHKLYCLGLTAAGHPRHPLYLPATASPREYPAIGGGA